MTERETRVNKVLERYDRVQMQADVAQSHGPSWWSKCGFSQWFGQRSILGLLARDLETSHQAFQLQPGRSLVSEQIACVGGWMPSVTRYPRLPARNLGKLTRHPRLPARNLGKLSRLSKVPSRLPLGTWCERRNNPRVKIA